MAALGRIRVVTDSLAWIPPELAQEHGIRVVPLHVHFGEEQFTEGVDLTSQEFYRRLRELKVLPKTSQPAAGEFLAAYREVARGASAIISIHASSKLSGTYRSAETAAALLRQERPDLRIEVLDTLQAATAEGIVAIRAAEDAARGASIEAALANARALVPKPRLLFVVETLEYLHKGGRIGRAQALLGGLLHIRPILTVADGEVAPKDRARTRAKAMERVLELMAEYAQGRPFGHVGIMHAEARDVGQELAARVQERFKLERLIFTEVGPVIGTYTGPGMFGASFHCD
jgi:DegV family protein with EDD domain